MDSHILKTIFFWVVTLNGELKIFNKSCCQQMCYHPGFIVPFIEYRQCEFNVILRVHRTFGMVNEHWLKLKLSISLAPSKRVSMSFAALKPDIDFSFLATKVLDGVFFQYEVVLSTFKICHLVWLPSLIILGNLLDKLLQHLYQQCCFTLHFYVIEELLSLNLMNHPLLALIFLLQLPYLSKPSENWREGTGLDQALV